MVSIAFIEYNKNIYFLIYQNIKILPSWKIYLKYFKTLNVFFFNFILGSLIWFFNNLIKYICGLEYLNTAIISYKYYR